VQALLDSAKEKRCDPDQCDIRKIENRAPGELCAQCPNRRNPPPAMSPATQKVLRMKRLRDGGYFAARKDARDLLTLAEWEALGIVSEMLTPRM